MRKTIKPTPDAANSAPMRFGMLLLDVRSVEVLTAIAGPFLKHGEGID
jgi:hypothetical protein